MQLTKRQLLEKKPEHRPASCSDVLRALEPFRSPQFRTQHVAAEVQRAVVTDQPAEVNPSWKSLPESYAVWQRYQDGAITACRLQRPQWLVARPAKQRRVAQPGLLQKATTSASGGLHLLRSTLGTNGRDAQNFVVPAPLS
jgi:hypothetical protein